MPGGGIGIFRFEPPYFLLCRTKGSVCSSRRIEATIARIAPEGLGNTALTVGQRKPSIAAMPDGRCIVTWQEARGTFGEVSFNAIHALIFDAHGSESVQEFLVNTSVANAQVASTLAALTDGRF